MQQDDVERWQAEKLHVALTPSLRYLGRLRARMETVGFLPNDKLYQLVTRAYDDLHHLCVELHYMSCSGGVGKRRPK